jgi:hypothetical protein
VPPNTGEDSAESYLWSHKRFTKWHLRQYCLLAIGRSTPVSQNGKISKAQVSWVEPLKEPTGYLLVGRCLLYIEPRLNGGHSLRSGP